MSRQRAPLMQVLSPCTVLLRTPPWIVPARSVAMCRPIVYMGWSSVTECPSTGTEASSTEEESVLNRGGVCPQARRGVTAGTTCSLTEERSVPIEGIQVPIGENHSHAEEDGSCIEEDYIPMNGCAATTETAPGRIEREFGTPGGCKNALRRMIPRLAHDRQPQGRRPDLEGICPRPKSANPVPTGGR